VFPQGSEPWIVRLTDGRRLILAEMYFIRAGIHTKNEELKEITTDSSNSRLYRTVQKNKLTGFKEINKMEREVY
jgi:hypothetical protein